MLKRFRNKKAQNTAEYAILIALVIGGVIAMQMYAQRTLQGRIRDVNVKFRDETNALGTTLQYEPYYTNKSETKDSQKTKFENTNIATDTSVATTVAAGYVDTSIYNKNAVGGGLAAAETAAGF